MKTPVRLKSQAGFSLIELMIVVAIIGILATIAIPNFQRFQAKARASESRAQLSALYAAEKAFSAEWNAYHSDLRGIGFRPEGSLRYLVGFGSDSAAAPPGYSGPALTASNRTTAVICDAITVADTARTQPCKNVAVNNAGTAVTAFAASPGTAAQSTFTAGAEGFVGGTQNDVWTINQDKTMINTQAGNF